MPEMGLEHILRGLYGQKKCSWSKKKKIFLCVCTKFLPSLTLTISPFTPFHFWSVNYPAYSLCSLETLAVLMVFLFTSWLSSRTAPIPYDTYKVDKFLAFSILVTSSSTSILPQKSISTPWLLSLLEFSTCEISIIYLLIYFTNAYWIPTLCQPLC